MGCFRVRALHPSCGGQPTRRLRQRYGAPRCPRLGSTTEDSQAGTDASRAIQLIPRASRDARAYPRRRSTSTVAIPAAARLRRITIRCVCAPPRAPQPSPPTQRPYVCREATVEHQSVGEQRVIRLPQPCMHAFARPDNPPGASAPCPPRSRSRRALWLIDGVYAVVPAGGASTPLARRPSRTISSTITISSTPRPRAHRRQRRSLSCRARQCSPWRRPGARRHRHCRWRHHRRALSLRGAASAPATSAGVVRCPTRRRHSTTDGSMATRSSRPIYTKSGCRALWRLAVMPHTVAHCSALCSVQCGLAQRAMWRGAAIGYARRRARLQAHTARRDASLSSSSRLPLIRPLLSLTERSRWPSLARRRHSASSASAGTSLCD